MNVFIGLIAMAVSAWSAWRYHQAVLIVFQGLLPISFFFAGLILFIAGIASFNSSRQPSPGKKDDA